MNENGMLDFGIYPAAYQEEITPTNQIIEKLTGYIKDGEFAAIDQEENTYAGPLKLDPIKTDKSAKDENGNLEKEPFETSSLKGEPDFVKGERTSKITNEKQKLTWEITKNVHGHQIEKTDFEGNIPISVSRGTFDYTT